MPDPDPRAAHVHARITDALLAAGRQPGGWASADPYSQRILPRHAALGGRLDELVSEAGYLEAADPDALLAVLPLTGTGPAGALIRTYRRAAHALASLRPAERAVGLDIAAIAAAETRPAHHGPSRVRWRRGPAAMELQTLTGHTDTVAAVAVGAIDDTPIIVSGSWDHTVRVWDARTGRPRGQPLTGHTDTVAAVAVGHLDDTPIIVSGSEDHTVRIWDARSMAVILVIPALVEVRSVAVVPDGVAIAAGSSVLVVDVPGLRPAPPRT